MGIYITWPINNSRIMLILNTNALQLTHWGRVMHICIGILTIIGSDNDLSPSRLQVIIWTNARILSIGPVGTNFSENLIKVQIFSFKKMELKMSSVKWRPFCLGLNVLTQSCTKLLSYGTNCRPSNAKTIHLVNITQKSISSYLYRFSKVNGQWRIPVAYFIMN